jgi:hypothetical protein
MEHHTEKAHVMSHILLIGIHGSEDPTRRPACWGLVQGYALPFGLVLNQRK